MKNITKAAVLSAAVALVGQAAHAASTGDLVLSFSQNDTGGTQEYTVDLGSLSSFTSAFPNTTHLGGSVNETTLTSTFFGANGNTGFNGLNVGAVAANNTHAGAGDWIALTAFRSGPNPTPASDGVTALPGRAALSEAATTVASVTTPNGLQLSSGSSSFSSLIAPDPNTVNANTFAQLAQNNPLVNLSGQNGQIQEDIWMNTEGASANSGWQYEGYLNINISGSSAVVDFVPVPEPSTYGLLAGAGLLAVCLRRQFTRKNA